MGAMLAQLLCAKRVKRTNEHPIVMFVHELLDTSSHFIRSTVSESQRKQPKRLVS